jgi:dTDP-4-dehydro-6-deoxy-alpha-D-glucopyranose 2,3-dehydratase
LLDPTSRGVSTSTKATIPAELRAALRRSRLAPADDSLLDWLAHHRACDRCRVEPIAFDQLRRWSMTPDREGIVHASGGFFSIRGFELELERGAGLEHLAQPLITQRERGILGVLLRVVEGRAELLVQAKREPGDPAGTQLAPTLQATHSNYARLHGGRVTRGLAAFLSPTPGAILFQADLSEQADLFLAKSNCNMAVMVAADEADALVAAPEFRWASLAELGRALGQANTVNMSLRSVLAALASLMIEDDPGPLVTRGWLAEIGARWTRRARDRRLDQLPGWRLTPSGLVRDDPSLGVAYVQVEAPTREVPRWTQPMLTRAGVGVIDLHVHRVADSLRVLLAATLGPGQVRGPALGLGSALPNHAPTGRVHFDTELAEDGGRLLGIRHRYRVIEHAEPFATPATWRWIGADEIPALLADGLLEIEARTALAALLLACPELKTISSWNAKRARTEAEGRVRAVSTGVKTITEG